jgi:hypothetical protein
MAYMLPIYTLAWRVHINLGHRHLDLIGIQDLNLPELQFTIV